MSLLLCRIGHRLLSIAGRGFRSFFDRTFSDQSATDCAEYFGSRAAHNGPAKVRSVIFREIFRRDLSLATMPPLIGERLDNVRE